MEAPPEGDAKDTTLTSTASRLFALIRALAQTPTEGARVTALAERVGLTQASAHRLLRALVEEGIVEQDRASKRYRLGLSFFTLAATAGNPSNLRTLCKPALLRLGASLGDAVFLMARSGFDAICLDRNEGPFPIRTFTGDIGGRVALGVGQGSLVILAFLPEDEREEVIRFNLPRLRDHGIFDEVSLRTEIEKVRACGYTARSAGLLQGMAGAAVPIVDRDGNAVAALSVGTLIDRLGPDRLPTVIDLLRREAQALTERIHPFDPTLRRPLQALSASQGQMPVGR